MSVVEPSEFLDLVPAARSVTPGLVLSPIGATTTSDLTPEVLTDVLTELRATEAAWSWIVGDLILAAVHHFGPTRGLTLIAEADLSQAHIARCVAVAERIPHARRHAALSWSHHELVAGMTEHDQVRLLDLAEQESLSVRALRAVIDQEREDLEPEFGVPRGEPVRPLTLAYRGDVETFAVEAKRALVACPWVSEPAVSAVPATGELQIIFTIVADF